MNELYTSFDFINFKIHASMLLYNFIPVHCTGWFQERVRA